MVELDAVGDMDAGDVRFRLVQHLLRDGAKRGAVRFHVACADADGNVELFMQAGFVRYGDERLLFRAPGRAAARADGRRARPREPASARRVPRTPSRSRACTRPSTPSPVQRLEALRLPDWERQGRDSRVPRSSLAPILRFADVEAFVLPAPDGGGRDGTQLDAFVQVGRRQGGPAALPQAARAPGGRRRPAPAVRAWASSARARSASSAHRQGVLAPVRTYESPVDRRLEEEGFDSIAVVTLLMKETLVRVAEPRLVPAGVR